MAKGDNDDGFAFNLFTDIAPLLALFGDQFAKQFMSEAISWVDHVIFAMVPLGILTAIVGAIRVSGPTWARALIGRSRETRAAAEIELMSSTSQEVCELWNGLAMVRTIGQPKIAQIIYLPAHKDSPTFGLYTLETAYREGLIKYSPFDGPLVPTMRRSLKGFVRFFTSFQRVFHPKFSAHKTRTRKDVEGRQEPQSPGSLYTEESHEKHEKSSRTGSSNTYLVDPFPLDPDVAPNIQLNLSKDTRQDGQLLGAAFFSITLQISLVAFAGVCAYHPRLIKAVGESDWGPAFSMLSVGTLVLVTGMILCSHVIEQSTTEYKWESTTDGGALDATILWLQKGDIVGDQKFGSFLIAAQDCDDILTSTRRKDKWDPAHLSWYNKIAHSHLEILSVVGAVSALLGFILQYEGLRQLSYPGSIAQLVAILIMVGVRALMRRGLAMTRKPSPVLDGYELDWLASKIGSRQIAFKSQSKEIGKSQAGKKRKEHLEPTEEFEDWEITTGGNLLAQNGHMNQSNDEKSDVPSVLSAPRKMLNIRRRLGQLTNWTVPASGQAATAVTQGVEIILNKFFGPDSEHTTFTWSMDAKSGEESGKIAFTASRNTQEDEWTLDSTEIESALSLWVFTILRRATSRRVEETSEYPTRRRSSCRALNQFGERDWLRQSSEDGLYYYRILGDDQDPVLKQDLSWFIGKDISEIANSAKASRAVETAKHSKETPKHSKETTRDSSDNKATKSRAETLSRVNTSLSTEKFVATARVTSVTFDDSSKSDELFADHRKDAEGDYCLDIGFKGREDMATSESELQLAGEPLYAKSSTPLVNFLAQHFLYAFMWAIVDYITPDDLGPTDILGIERLLDQDFAKSWRTPRLANNLLSEIARAIEATGLGSADEILLILIPPLSTARKFNSEAMGDLVRRVMDKQTRLDGLLEKLDKSSALKDVLENMEDSI